MSCIQLRTGLDLTRNGSDARDPVEGSNVVLICRAYALSSPPRWTYYQSVDDTAEEQVNISESETPSELGKSKSQRRSMIPFDFHFTVLQVWKSIRQNWPFRESQNRITWAFWNCLMSLRVPPKSLDVGRRIIETKSNWQPFPSKSHASQNSSCLYWKIAKIKKIYDIIFWD